MPATSRTLMDIGLAGLLALPFINNVRVRVAAAFGMVTLYQVLCDAGHQIRATTRRCVRLVVA
jgi:hypothetical protein